MTTVPLWYHIGNYGLYGDLSDNINIIGLQRTLWGNIFEIIPHLMLLRLQHSKLLSKLYVYIWRINVKVRNIIMPFKREYIITLISFTQLPFLGYLLSLSSKVVTQIYRSYAMDVSSQLSNTQLDNMWGLWSYPLWHTFRNSSFW
jgi:hypothetical protein